MAIRWRTAAVAAAVVFSCGGAAALELAPHRAIYSMSLAGDRGRGDIVDMHGRMFLEWVDVCDGWTVNQRVRLTSTLREGHEIDNRFHFSSWESKDGLRLRFNMRSLSMGDLVEDVRGEAVLDDAGGGGRVEFQRPEDAAIDLPPGTMFPSSHLVLLVEAAMAGERHVERPVFSGSGLDSLNPVTAFFGRDIPGGAQPVAPDADQRSDEVQALAERRSWPVSLAYFPLEGDMGEPEFEVGYRLFDNGIATDLVLDYGDFVLNATLAELEVLPQPDC